MPKKQHRHHKARGSRTGRPGRECGSNPAERPSGPLDEPVGSSVQTDGPNDNSLSGAHYPPVVGLDNLGNTCFFNSAIQMLQSAPQLREHYTMNPGIGNTADGPLGEGLREVIANTFSNDVESSEEGLLKYGSFNPRKLLDAICDIAPQFKGQDQHDSHELLRFLLDGLQTEERKLANAQSLIIKRATDVEEGLIFRRLSRDSNEGEAERLLVDLSDVKEFSDKFVLSKLPESDPVFAEDDNLYHENDLGDNEKIENMNIGDRRLSDALSTSMAALARAASAKALRRSLSASATDRPPSHETDISENSVSHPAALIASMTANHRLQRSLSAAPSLSQCRRLSLIHDHTTSNVDRCDNVPVEVFPANDNAYAVDEAENEEIDDSESEECNDCCKAPKAHSSFVEQLFYGELSSTIKCYGCEYKSVTMEPFLDLSIPIPWRAGQVAFSGKSVAGSLDKNGDGRKKDSKDRRSGAVPVKGKGKVASKSELSSKEQKRLAKESKKREKMQRRRAADNKHGSEFEMILTEDQQNCDTLAETKADASLKHSSQEIENHNDDSVNTTGLPHSQSHEGNLHESRDEGSERGLCACALDGDKDASERGGQPPTETDVCGNHEMVVISGGMELIECKELEDTSILDSIDALEGCDMQSDNCEEPMGALPDFDPDDESFSLFTDEESKPKFNSEKSKPRKYSAYDRDMDMIDELSGASAIQELSVMGCLAAFFRNESLEWECPAESGKLKKEMGTEDKILNAASKDVQASEPKLDRRVSFAGPDGELDVTPAKQHISWSKDPPKIYKISGSEEQRGTDFSKAMKGEDTFNKPFTYSGNDFIVRVRLDGCSYDRLEVLIGPNWDEDAEDVWPDEQKVADIQIDEIPYEDHDTEEAQLMLLIQAQILLDCFSDLFSCQGPTGFLNILRAGFVALEERDGDDGRRWVVEGRFPPGQIGGAKGWTYPPSNDASYQLFAACLTNDESPLPSPTPVAPIRGPNFAKSLKSSLKTSKGVVREGAHALTIPLSQITISGREPLLSISPQETFPPPLQHFPPSVAYPSESERAVALEDMDDEGSGTNEITDASRADPVYCNAPDVSSRTKASSCHEQSPFDWSTYDGTNAPSDSCLHRGLLKIPYVHYIPEDSATMNLATGELDGNAEDELESCVVNEASGLAGKVINAGLMDGSQYVRRPRGTNTDSIGEMETGKLVEEEQSSIQEPESQATALKGSLKKQSFQRQAEKGYLIYRAPEILTIHLKRFQQDLRGRLQKINGNIPFDFDLDLHPFCDPDGPDKHGARYELISVVEHQGTLRGGHYVAYVRRTAQVPHIPGDERYPPKWFYTSDSLQRPCDECDVRSCEAYMLMYLRCP